jgi:Alkylmercury lyase
MALEVATAAQVIALDVDGRGVTRRAARETELLRGVFRSFVNSTDPVLVEEIAASFAGQAPEKVFAALARLDEDDLIRIRGGRIDLAYPFSASPTPVVVALGRGRGDRYVCCAIDALGLAPMLGEPMRVRSRCLHCAMLLELSVTPSAPGPDAEGLMVWVGKRPEDERRACDSL